MDENWRRAMLSEGDSLSGLFNGIFASPISIVLFTLISLIALSQTPIWAWIKSLKSKR